MIIILLCTFSAAANTLWDVADLHSPGLPENEADLHFFGLPEDETDLHSSGLPEEHEDLALPSGLGFKEWCASLGVVGDLSLLPLPFKTHISTSTFNFVSNCVLKLYFFYMVYGFLICKLPRITSTVKWVVYKFDK